MKSIRIILLPLILIILLGCVSATGTYILTGEPRTAINSRDVQIYLDPPSRFELIGLVEASCEVGSKRQKAQDMVIDELKKQAAKIGANGIILITTGSSSSGGVFIFNVYVANEIITVRGQAVYINRN